MAKIPTPNENACDHVWVRRRDGKVCVLCEARLYGSSALTPEEQARIQEFRRQE